MTWTREEIEVHVKNNLEDGYNSAVLVGAFFKKLYGIYPKIGLSGFQAQAIDSVVESLPDAVE